MIYQIGCAANNRIYHVLILIFAPNHGINLEAHREKQNLFVSRILLDSEQAVVAGRSVYNMYVKTLYSRLGGTKAE